MPDGRAAAERHYLGAVEAGCFDEALSCVYGLLERQEAVLSAPEKARFLLRIGALFAKLSQHATADFFYGLAIDCDAHNPANMLAYATFLVEEVKDAARGMRLCDEIIAAAGQGDCPDIILARARDLRENARTMAQGEAAAPA